jgi:hypothetical protein
MDIFREIHLRGSTEQVDAVVREVEKSLTAGWTRDAKQESRMRSMSSPDDATFCFTCDQAGKRPAATVFLMKRASGTFKTYNVVPHKLHQLSHAQYNGILEEFFRRFIRSAAERLGVEAELTDDKVDLENWMSPEAAEKLRRFSMSANKSTGSAHPSDQELWMDFIVAAQRERAKIDPATLRRWLVEVGDWPEEVADDLASEYEFGKDILAFALSERVGA